MEASLQEDEINQLVNEKVMESGPGLDIFFEILDFAKNVLREFITSRVGKNKLIS